MDDLFDRVAAALGPFDGDPVALDGGITNRNHRWGDYVIREPGPKTDALGIDRVGEAAAARLAAKLGIGPAVFMDEPLVTGFVEGRTLTDEDLAGRADDVRGLLSVLHGSGATLPTTFDPVDVVQDHARQAAPPVAHRARIDGLRSEPYTAVPTHNDLLAGNLIERPDGSLVLLDWEYAGMGDPRFDLANLAMHAGLPCDDAYALELSLLREAMWGVVQAANSDLDFDFTGYAEDHFARLT